MKTSNVRINVIKGLFNDIEKDRLRKACNKAGRTCSEVIRDVSGKWAEQQLAEQQHVMPRKEKTEWPGFSANMAMPQASRGRVNYGVAHQMRRPRL